MRCLTLAEALRNEGAEISFISRELPGNIIERVETQGFLVRRLIAPDGQPPAGPPKHAAWAGVSWQRDAEETGNALEAGTPDWLVVDHYALDQRWEKAVRRDGMRTMVIDDIADRPHDCDLLLDQNLGRETNDYESLVPRYCRHLIGPRYALLRPEFSVQRGESLARRKGARLEHLLVSMGGIDKENITGCVLEALQEIELPSDCRVTVVLGESAPWFEEVSVLSANSGLPVKLLRGVEDMAKLMSESDFAIGGAGGTSWERCCLGLPSLIIVVAENQYGAAKALRQYGAAQVLNPDQSIIEALKQILAPSEISRILQSMSTCASKITDGYGTTRVIECMGAAK